MCVQREYEETLQLSQKSQALQETQEDVINKMCVTLYYAVYLFV